jgi:hypothetical protein
MVYQSCQASSTDPTEVERGFLKVARLERPEFINIPLYWGICLKTSFVLGWREDLRDHAEVLKDFLVQ